MNFNEAFMCLEMVLATNAVPLLIGESGIGKTSLIKKLAEKNNYYMINIDGNILKEGEIGGLPTVEDYVVHENGKHIVLKRTVYAVHTKLQEIKRVLKEDPEKTIILFIDELNRSEHSVQQELMNIILNREINGFIIPKQVKVAAAMNPSSNYNEYRQTDYQVVDMDPAQEDRFVWIDMEIDVKEWLAWGMESSNIHMDIINFISSFPDYLHTPFSQETVKATPRSWERVSDSYEYYLENKERIPQKIFYNVVKGNVGASIAQEFINFLGNSKNPILTPEEIFISETLLPEVIDRIKKDSHSRLYLIARNVFKYIVENEDKEHKIELFSELLQYYPKDLRLAVMKELKESYKDSIYEKFLMNDNFIELFFSTVTY